MSPATASEPITAASLTTQELYRELLLRIGEDPTRDGLVDTPERMEKSMAFLTRGYTMDINTVLHEALFDVDYDEMVIVKDIEFFSMCEHHLLPFFGKAHVAYVPNGKVIGLSKIPRVVDIFARRLQVQERLTTQIAEALIRILEARGAIVVIEAEQLCMTMRGVRKPGSKTVTSAVRGSMHNAATRSEAMSLIMHGTV